MACKENTRMGVTEPPPPEESPQIKRKKIVDNNKEKRKNILMFNQGVLFLIFVIVNLQ